MFVPDCHLTLFEAIIVITLKILLIAQPLTQSCVLKKHSFLNTPEWPLRNNHTVILSPSLYLPTFSPFTRPYPAFLFLPHLNFPLSHSISFLSLHPSPFSIALSVSPRPPEHGRGDIPSFYTCEEGLSSLNSEGEATLSRLEGMLARSVAQQFHMAGVRTDDTSGDFDGS